MKTKIFKIVSICLVVFTMLGLLAGCGASKSEMDVDYGGAMNGITGDFMEDSYESNDVVSKEEVSTESSGSDNESVSTNRKIIERIYFSVQTKEFDTLMSKLEDEIKTLGGYIENSSVSGNSYEEKGNRRANLVVRVPSKKSADLTAFVSENSTVTNKEVNTEDVTLSYVDMQSRVKALTTEKETLERLLAGATSMADVIAIQDRLTDVIYEIESYESKLRTYDNLIEYTTVTIRISEVERVQVVEEQTMWQEIASDFKENMEDIGHGCKRLFIAIVGGFPYIVINGAIIFIAIVIIKRYIKKSKKKEIKPLPYNTNTTPIEKKEDKK